MPPSINALDARPESAEATGTTDGREEIAQLPGGAFFEGQWQTSELTLEVRDPEDDVLLGLVCSSTAADVGRATAYIHRHLQRDEWPLRLRRQALEWHAGCWRSRRNASQ